MTGNSHSLDVRPYPAGIHRIQPEGTEIAVEWSSRSHRKRRNPRLLEPAQAGRGCWKLWAWVPGNVSWWVPFFFTLGSLVWLLNGVLAVWPPQSTAVGQWELACSALLGGFIFILGAYAALFEVFNRPSYIHLHKQGADITTHPSHHPDERIAQPGQYSWFALEPGNWAWWLNFLQMVGALIFFLACASGLALPLHRAFDEKLCYWAPQMVGAVFFFISALMAMREVQASWWQPAWKRIGWHAALFNAIGAAGFFLCAWFGAFASSPEALFWGSAVSTFWGSIAFLVSSYLIMLEVLNP